MNQEMNVSSQISPLTDLLFSLSIIPSNLNLTSQVIFSLPYNLL